MSKYKRVTTHDGERIVDPALVLRWVGRLARLEGAARGRPTRADATLARDTLAVMHTPELAAAMALRRVPPATLATQLEALTRTVALVVGRAARQRPRSLRAAVQLADRIERGQPLTGAEAERAAIASAFGIANQPEERERARDLKRYARKYAR